MRSNAAMQRSWSRNSAVLLRGIPYWSRPSAHSKNGFSSLIKKYMGMEFNHVVQDIFRCENEISRADRAIVDGAYIIAEASNNQNSKKK